MEVVCQRVKLKAIANGLDHLHCLLDHFASIVSQGLELNWEDELYGFGLCENGFSQEAVDYFDQIAACIFETRDVDENNGFLKTISWLRKTSILKYGMRIYDKLAL